MSSNGLACIYTIHYQFSHIQFTFFFCNFWIFTSLLAISASLLLRARFSLVVHCSFSSVVSHLCNCLFKFFIFDCFSCTIIDFFCSCWFMSSFVEDLGDSGGMSGMWKSSSRSSFSLSFSLFFDNLRSSSLILLSSSWISLWFTGFP